MIKRVMCAVLILAAICLNMFPAFSDETLSEEVFPQIQMTKEFTKQMISDFFLTDDRQRIAGFGDGAAWEQPGLTETGLPTAEKTYVLENGAQVHVKAEAGTDGSIYSSFREREEEAEYLFVPFYGKDKITGEIVKNKYPTVMRVRGKKRGPILFVRKAGSIKEEKDETDSRGRPFPVYEETNPGDVDCVSFSGAQWALRPEKVTEEGFIIEWSCEILSDWQEGGKSHEYYVRFTFSGINSAVSMESSVETAEMIDSLL